MSLYPVCSLPATSMKLNIELRLFHHRHSRCKLALIKLRSTRNARKDKTKSIWTQIWILILIYTTFSPADTREIFTEYAFPIRHTLVSATGCVDASLNDLISGKTIQQVRVQGQHTEFEILLKIYSTSCMSIRISKGS